MARPSREDKPCRIGCVIIPFPSYRLKSLQKNFRGIYIPLTTKYQWFVVPESVSLDWPRRMKFSHWSSRSFFFIVTTVKNSATHIANSRQVTRNILPGALITIFFHSSSTSANDREHTRAALKSPPRRSRRSSDYRCRCVLLFLLFRVILCVLTILADDPSGTLPRYHVNWLAIITRDHLQHKIKARRFPMR